MTTRIYEYQARPALTVAIEQAQWMEGGCDVVIDSLHKVDNFHVPPAERKRMAAALDPEVANLRAQLAAAEKRVEAHRVDLEHRLEIERDATCDWCGGSRQMPRYEDGVRRGTNPCLKCSGGPTEPVDESEVGRG